MKVEDMASRTRNKTTALHKILIVEVLMSAMNKRILLHSFLFVNGMIALCLYRISILVCKCSHRKHTYIDEFSQNLCALLYLQHYLASVLISLKRYCISS
jgi:hypothetical protein